MKPNPASCLDCQYAHETHSEIRCTHWHHTGRVMARDLRYDESPLAFVSGMEWAKHCVNHKPKESPFGQDPDETDEEDFRDGCPNT